MSCFYVITIFMLNYLNDSLPERIFKYLKHPTNKTSIKESKICSGDNINFKEVQKIISQSNFLISGRYHHLIFGANTNTPLCFMGSTSHKVHGLSELLTGKPHQQVYDPTNIKMTTDKIIDTCITTPSIKWNPIELKKQFIKYINNEIINQ